MHQITISPGVGTRNKKRIGIMHYTLPPGISGVEMVIRDHARLLSNVGFKVFLLGAQGKKFRSEIKIQISPSLDPKNSKVLAIQKELKEQIVSDQFIQLKKKYIRILKKWIEENKLETVICHNVLSRHYNLALTSALVEIAEKLKETVKFISWVHDASFIDTFYTKLGTELKKQYPWNLIANYNSGFTCVTISETRKKELTELYGVGKLIQVVPNGIDLDKMLPLPLQTRILFKDIFHKNPDYIGLIPVRIAERKNIEFAIKFAKEARDKFKVKFFFIITGALHLQNPETIHYFKYLKKLIQQDDLTDNFCFLYQFGLSTGEQFDIYKLNIRDLYIISDFLFLPSKGEGFGLPIIEAGFMRIPIFVSELPVFKEVGNGFINTFNLDDDINITVSKTLNYLNRNRATIFHKHILKNFSLEAIVQNKIIDLL